MYNINYLKFVLMRNLLAYLAPFVPKNAPATPPIKAPRNGTGITVCPRAIPPNVLPIDIKAPIVTLPI
jgi:hypothetical protein